MRLPVQQIHPSIPSAELLCSLWFAFLSPHSQAHPLSIIQPCRHRKCTPPTSLPRHQIDPPERSKTAAKWTSGLNVESMGIGMARTHDGRWRDGTALIVDSERGEKEVKSTRWAFQLCWPVVGSGKDGASLFRVLVRSRARLMALALLG